MEADSFHEIMTELADGAVPGTSQFLKHYQPGRKRLVDGLSDVKRAEYTKMAEEWNNTAAPRHLQVKAFKKDKDKMIRAFAEDMWKTYGVRVVVFAAFKEADNTAAAS